MLEKIGLPAKPSVRGNTWVVDASHCQGCSSQFTFINRKHHCRRCGGLFCNSCSAQRMVLRGQGDSPVRICEPCKKLEEASRFELRYGHKNKAARGSSKLMSNSEDEVLNQILGNDRKASLSSHMESNIDVSSFRSTSSSSSHALIDDGKGEFQKSYSIDGPNHVANEMESTSPEDLRQQALDEKKKYKSLKGEGKAKEALVAFKRGKELERQAEALELYLRKKSRKKVLPPENITEIGNNGGESGRKLLSQVSKEKGDLFAELRELGWSDKDLRGQDEKPASMSLEGELSSLIGEVSQRTNKTNATLGTDKSQVVAHKKKALMLKREGKLAEAKEELKKAKVLEKKLEEEELLAGADDSDDELSALIRSMDNEREEMPIEYEQDHGFDFGNLADIADDLVTGSHFEVTDEDMEDPEITAALNSFGWIEDQPHDVVAQKIPVIDREALSSELLSLKKDALSKKREGNVAEAMVQLKKAKILEKELQSLESQEETSIKTPADTQNGLAFHTTDISSKSIKVACGNDKAPKDANTKVIPKSKLVIQKELLALKKKALALKREGRLDEAEDELKKGRVLELQLEEIDNSSKAKPIKITVTSKEPDQDTRDLPHIDGEEVTDQDMCDPSYLLLLQNLGWKDEEDNKPLKLLSIPLKQRDEISSQKAEPSVMKAPSNISSSRNKSEMQRELLGIKRKAFALRRQGKTEEAEEVLIAAKTLEFQIQELEGSSKEVQYETVLPKENITIPRKNSVKESLEEDVTENDMQDPALLSMLNNLGWKDDEIEPVTVKGNPSNEISGMSVYSTGRPEISPFSETSMAAAKSKGQIQKELLGLKRKALALRRKGETEEADEMLRMAKTLEAQIEVLEAPKQGILLSLTSPIKESETINPSLTPFDGLIPVVSPLKEKQPLSVELSPLGDIGAQDHARTAEGTTAPPDQSLNMIDLLSGDIWSSSEISVENNPGDARKLKSEFSLLPCTPNQTESLTSPVTSVAGQDNVTTGRREEKAFMYEKPEVHTTNLAPAPPPGDRKGLATSEILAHKRKALALKREGRLAEAKEELRQAKLLEKSMEEDKLPPKGSTTDVSVDASKESSNSQNASQPNVAPKPLSSRDRFKLQQESLSHKRQALKLRREGRTQEADAEFELAKALEAQLEESASQDSTKSEEAAYDVVVEDLLDPELLSALRGIGLEDTTIISKGPGTSQSVKSTAGKSEIPNQERIQLEERIKAEKLKSLNLKRSGKQTEALDALRRAKMLEKKLNSLA